VKDRLELLIYSYRHGLVTVPSHQRRQEATAGSERTRTPNVNVRKSSVVRDVEAVETWSRGVRS
jgi:hypothetical protein